MRRLMPSARAASSRLIKSGLTSDVICEVLTSLDGCMRATMRADSLTCNPEIGKQKLRPDFFTIYGKRNFPASARSRARRNNPSVRTRPFSLSS